MASLKSSPPQADQTQLSQALLIPPVLQPPDHIGGSPLMAPLLFNMLNASPYLIWAKAC